jgi:hypothetical protein
LKKIHHFGGPKHSPIPVLPGLDRKKKSSSTYFHIAVMLNLKFQLDKFRNNEEKAIIVFFAVFLIINKMSIFFHMNMAFFFLLSMNEVRGLYRLYWPKIYSRQLKNDNKESEDF